jgi:hypothetical protein
MEDMTNEQLTPEQLLNVTADFLDKLFVDPEMGELLFRFPGKSRYLRFRKDGTFVYSSDTGKIGPS